MTEDNATQGWRWAKRNDGQHSWPLLVMDGWQSAEGAFGEMAWHMPAEVVDTILAALQRPGREASERTDMEVLAAKVHQAYLDTCQVLGWSVKPENAVPYEELDDRSKELDRASVRAVLAAIGTREAACEHTWGYYPPLQEIWVVWCLKCGTIKKSGEGAKEWDEPKYLIPQYVTREAALVEALRQIVAFDQAHWSDYVAEYGAWDWPEGLKKLWSGEALIASNALALISSPGLSTG